MDIFNKIIHGILFFEKEPQRIGLSQFKSEPKIQKPSNPLRKKEVKLSDLMRRAG